MLYLALGDGGEANDVGPGHPAIGNGQDWTTLMGSIIRIDPDGGEPYGIPADNPFVGEHEGADEIWAYGLRNPFAFAFDTETGALFAGDVGQNLMEEVDIIEAGNNYGWNIKEGTLCFDPNDADEPLPACLDGGPNGEPLVDPILTYTHPDTIVSGMSEIQGITVLGGRVYRGALLDELYGAYVFGDYSRSFTEPEGQLLVGLPDGESWTLEQLPVEGSGPDHLGRFVRGFGEDADGELYVLTSDESGPNGSTGMVWRLTRAESP
jgi:glucose/arabinose dehydrogenase